MTSHDHMERLRLSLKLHWLFSIVFSLTICLLINYVDFLNTDHCLSVFVYIIVSGLIKEFLYRKGPNWVRRFFWVYDILDVTGVSLVYYLGYFPFNYLLPLYLLIIYGSAPEIVTGEIKFVTLLSLGGFLLNVTLLWKNGTTLFEYMGVHQIVQYIAALVSVVSIITAGFSAHSIARIDRELLSGLKRALMEKEEHLKKLNETNAFLEEKYAASYTLSLIQQYILQELNEAKLLTKIADIVQGILGSSISAIYGLTGDNKLKLLSYSGIKDLTLLEAISEEPDSLLYNALHSLKILYVDDAAPVEKRRWQEHGIKSLLFIPLYTKGDTLGVMFVGHFQEEVFTDDQIELLQIIANQISMAMENIKLHQETVKMAWHDQLTGLLNRGYLNNYLAQMQKEYGSELCVKCLLLDIDHFKQVNDRYGHLTGDKVLKKVAEVILKHAAKNCISVRFGGEEFIIISTVDELTRLMEIAESIRHEIADTDFSYDGDKSFNITISGGIAAIPEHAWTIEQMLMKADEALYRAKEFGRNRIYVYNRQEEQKCLREL